MKIKNIIFKKQESRAGGTLLSLGFELLIATFYLNSKGTDDINTFALLSITMIF